MSKFVYEEDWIVNEYKQAKDKSNEVKILSELNVCSVDDIIELLTERGAITGIKQHTDSTTGVKKKRGENTVWTPELDAEVSRLFKEGMKITEISERLGIKKQAIYDRRSHFNKMAKKFEEDFAPKVITEEKENDMKDIIKEAKPIEAKENATEVIADSETVTEVEKTGEVEKLTVSDILNAFIVLCKEQGVELSECSVDLLSGSFCIRGGI